MCEPTSAGILPPSNGLRNFSVSGSESASWEKKEDSRSNSEVPQAVTNGNEEKRGDYGDDVELDRALTKHFDVEDAMRMQTNGDGSESGGEKRVQEYAGNDSRGYEADDGKDNDTLRKVFTNHSTGEIDLPPDGGYGWVVTLCVFLVMFSTWGCNSGFGIFLAFYLKSGEFAGANRFDYATIAGLTVACGQGFAPIVAVCYRVIGCKPTMLLGTVFMFSGFLMASFAESLWELYLTQGLLIGLSISFSFVPATVVLPGWFLKKRAYAIGISYMGTGCGGVTYGLAVNKMINDSHSTRWALRILCISCTCSMLVAITFIKQRNPLPITGIRRWKPIWEQIKIVFNIKVAKNPSVFIIGFWFTFSLFGYNLMMYTLSSYAQGRGLSAHDGSSLTAITNGAQAIGRPIMGLIGDRFGRTNTTIVLSSLLTIYLFAFWIPAHTMLQLIFFCLCMGSCVGVAQVMNTVLTADLVAPEDFLPSWAFVNASGAPYLLCCEIISQALVTKDKSNPYLHTQCYGGSCFAVSLITILVLRERAVRVRLGKMAEQEGIGFDAKNDAEIQSNVTPSHRYSLLLGASPTKYLKRLTYPMKV